MQPPSRRRSSLLAALLWSVLLVTGCGSDSDQATLVPDQSTAETLLPLTDGPSSAPTTIAASPTTSYVATSVVDGETEIFDAPDGAVTQTLPNPWVGESPLVFLVKNQVSDDWIEVYLPVRPNGSSGFVRASDVTLTSHEWRIEVRLSDFQLSVYDGDEVFLDTEVAVAADNTPTPGGLYYTTELLQPPDPNGVYGTYAYGLSGFSDAVPNFNGGEGQLGIHGTNQPELIGQQVSHGCIRMTNEDIERLAAVLPLGVPVEVIT